MTKDFDRSMAAKARKLADADLKLKNRFQFQAPSMLRKTEKGYCFACDKGWSCKLHKLQRINATHETQNQFLGQRETVEHKNLVKGTQGAKGKIRYDQQDLDAIDEDAGIALLHVKKREAEKKQKEEQAQKK